MRDAVDAATGGPAMRTMQDLFAKDTLRHKLTPTNSMTEIIRSIKLADDLNRQILGFRDLPLTSALGRLASAPSWLDKTLELANPSWLKAATNLPGTSNIQRIVDHANRQFAVSPHMFEHQPASLRAVNEHRPGDAPDERLDVAPHRLRERATFSSLPLPPINRSPRCSGGWGSTP